MKQVRKLLGVILAAAVLVFSVCAPAGEAYAAQTATTHPILHMPDGCDFDPAYYAQMNPDIVPVIGNTTVELYKHFLQFGRKEARAYMKGVVKDPQVSEDGSSISQITVTDGGRVYITTADTATGASSVEIVEPLEMKLLATCSTPYKTNCARGGNVELASGFINGSVVFPGEVFSYSNTVGPRTWERGFREAGVYLQGEVVQGMGGGICQVSSTLYSALLDTNLLVVERHPHSMPVTYIATGRDATVSGNVLDLKFMNNSEHPIYIQSFCEGGYITVMLLEMTWV